MDNILMYYSNELKAAMNLLAKDSRTVFLGQAVAFPGHNLSKTLIDVPSEKRIEMPVAEELQMGITIGLSLEGYIPISIYPRMDFLLLALNQLVNHLDKIPILTNYKTIPITIIRVAVGGKTPLYPGVQHCQNYENELRTMCRNIDVVSLTNSAMIVDEYKKALNSNRSTILVEYGDIQ